MGNDSIVRKGRFSELVCVHHDRSTYSSRCSKSQHGNCNGNVLKSRSPDRICHCGCHEEVKCDFALVISCYGKNDFVLKI